MVATNIGTEFMQSLMKRAYETAVRTGLRKGVDVLARMPDDILIPFVRSKLSEGIRFPDGVEFLTKMTYEFKRRYNDFHPNVRRRFVENLFGNELLLSADKHRKVEEKLGTWPALMVISPTMRCNLKCVGCYSANYNKKDAIDTKTFDRILTEAEEMGIYFVVVSGGEPFLRKDLLDMFEKHSGMLFMTYTNGTIIYDKKLAPRLAELGNVIPCISVEGFAEETEKRRGKGVYKKIIGAMTQLRNEGVMFGFSATPMRHNNELLVSDEFVEFYENLGAFLGWYFSYMPVGRDPDLNLMPTPKQREYRYRRIRELRRKYHILLSDFWCDGALVGGCLSSGRSYFHINADGGVEPCVFHQFWVDKIQDKPLIEALNSTYFRFMREKLAEFDNPLRPCPVIDRPWVLREAYNTFKPNVSQHGGTKTITEFAEGLDKYAKELAEIFDPIWEREKPEGWGPTSQSGIVDKRPLWRKMADALIRKAA